jgi:hypothetical protein
MQLTLSWTDLKTFSTNNLTSIHWLSAEGNYYIWSNSGPTEVSLIMPIVSPTPSGSDQEDFENNFKPTTGATTKQPAIVTTQFELNDKDLKLASGEAAVDGSGNAVLNFKVPGTYANGDGRWLTSGTAWFDSPNAHDTVTEINIIDTDNVLGYGANTVVKTYHDNEMPSDQTGWRIPNIIGFAKVETLAGYGFVPAEFTIQIKAKKGAGITSGYFFVNLEWGKSG